MITVKNQSFLLETDNTSYLFSYTESGLLLHKYYGKKIRIHDENFLLVKLEGGFGTSILYEGNPSEHVNHMDLEFSSFGIGDFREPVILINHPKFGYYVNFKYVGYEILKKNAHATPHSYDEDEVLRVDLEDSVLQLKAELYYKVFSSSDTICRYIRIINNSENKYIVNRLYSMQLDLPSSDYFMMTFDGTWAKERHVNQRKLSPGIFINDSKTGSSSNRHNPLVILRKENTDELHGECIGFNLVYSGNHRTAAEVSETGRCRIVTGINDFAFHFGLEPGRDFVTPEAVFTYTKSGLNQLSQNFHDFVNNHIVRGNFKRKQRPVVINSWEANYFNFNEKKLLELARKAKEVGIELFVLDDGWFGKRNNDKASLGDWDVNPKKLPNGLKGISEKINKIGLDFGLWVEPEMVNEDSDLYRNHPDWAVLMDNRKPGLGRNQLVLDLTNPEVRKYLIEKLTSVFSSCNLRYVKWDYNRNISDMFGKTLADQGEFFHRYILGFYEIMDKLTRIFPDILFEGCASGGNRYDLGMLCYFPQIWTSDNTDYLERVYIQTGTSYGYPLSAITNHVSSVPNHQTLRNTPLSSRFHIACFGCLGYELDLTESDKEELGEIKEQIRYYKQYREVFQYGKFFRSEKNFSNSNTCYFYVIDDNKELSVVGLFQSLIHPSVPEDILYVRGLKQDELFHFVNKKHKLNLKQFGGLINFVSPIRIKVNGKIHNLLARFYHPRSEIDRYIVYGDALADAGVHLTQQFMGTGFSDKVRVMLDFGTRMYTIRAIHPRYHLLRSSVKIQNIE